MARLFDDAQTEYLAAGSALLSAAPLAMAGWFYSDSATANQAVMTLANGSSDTNYYSLWLAGGIAGDKVYFTARAGNYNAAVTSAGYSTNTWHHACGIEAAANDRRVLIDAGGRGTESTSRSPAGLDNTSIGSSQRLSDTTYMSGRLAEVGLWDLTDWPGATAADKADEFERVAVPALAAGYSPLFFLLGLKAYYPLDEASGTADGFDHVGHYDMTAYNMPSVADHPGGLIFPSAAVWVPPTAAPPAGGNPWYAYAQQA